MENTTDQPQSSQDKPIPSQQPPAIPPQQASPPVASEPMQSMASLPNLPNSPNSPNPPIQKTHHFPLHKVLLIIVLVLTIIFATAYIGVYYLLNQQLDKLTHANKISPTPPITLTTPTPTQSQPITPTTQATLTPSQTVCSQEAKLCPDGKTSVSRQGLACELAACPSI